MVVTEHQGKLQTHVSLARYTTWKIGGPARHMYFPVSLDDLCGFLRSLPADVPVFFLGLGSNTLVRSGGLGGVVIALQGCLHQCESVTPDIVFAEAGVATAQLARFTMRRGLAGLEFLAGIPGTVGGALAMNAGCHGSETWDHVISVRTVNRLGDVRTRFPAEFKVAYREVIFPREEWFVGATFKVTPGDAHVSKQRIHEYLSHRKTTQPIHLPNGGCVFRNPPGEYAGRLIDACELKGVQYRGAEVSLQHANFIVHHGETTPEAVEQLIQFVEDTVFEKTGVRLQREIRIVGKEARS